MRIDEKYIWTNHAREKMRYYRLSESRVSRVIRRPVRMEEGIIEDAIGAMQPAHSSGQGPSVVAGRHVHPNMTSEARPNKFGRPASVNITAGRSAGRYTEIWVLYVLVKTKDKTKRIKVITAWRYPGRAPERKPIPPEILREIRGIL